MDCKSGNIDLHIHSTASDGSLDPLEIPPLAKKAGLSAFALTDHDSVEGARKILAHPHVLGTLRFLTGVEISAAPPDSFSLSGSFHILGYGFAPDHPELGQTLQHQQDARKNRNPAMIARLNELGFDMTLAEVVAASEENAQIGRPHIARLMVKKGLVPSINAAFDAYLGKDKPAYVDKPRVHAAKAISLIRSAGGIAVLAHPGLVNVHDGATHDDLIAELKRMGLGGIEVFYPNHTPEQTRYFEQLAEKFDLLVTGGSDFHGAITLEILVGSGSGELAVPFSLFERLTDAIRRLQSGASAP